jgi:hypothetical protein
VIATFGSRPAGVIGARTPSAASRVRRANSSRLDTQRAGGAAGFRSSRCWDPRAATARPEARTAPRSTGARHREVAEQASSHQGVPWENFQSKSDTGIEFPERLVTSSALARNSPGESLTKVLPMDLRVGDRLLRRDRRVGGCVSLLLSEKVTGKRVAISADGTPSGLPFQED